MVELTRLNGDLLVVNSDLIKFIERAHDTVITLANGEKIVVGEAPHEIVERVIGFRQRLLQLSPPTVHEETAASGEQQER